jgi:hypothetical protein
MNKYVQNKHVLKTWPTGGMATVATEVLPFVSWPEWFNARQNIDLDIENTPYINAPGTELGNNDGRNYIRTPGGENLPRSERLLQYLRRSEILDNFCGQICLRDLESGTPENTTKNVASLDDRNATGVLLVARGQCRPHKGPLTQQGLYRELRRKVCQSCSHIKFMHPSAEARKFLHIE